MVGAIVLTPLVGVIRVVRSELASADFPGATVRSDPSQAASQNQDDEQLEPVPMRI